MSFISFACNFVSVFKVPKKAIKPRERASILSMSRGSRQRNAPLQPPRLLQQQQLNKRKLKHGCLQHCRKFCFLKLLRVYTRACVCVSVFQSSNIQVKQCIHCKPVLISRASSKMNQATRLVHSLFLPCSLTTNM